MAKPLSVILQKRNVKIAVTVKFNQKTKAVPQLLLCITVVLPITHLAESHLSFIVGRVTACGLCMAVMSQKI